MAYKPIENYGLIGDLRTVALVGMDGSIDWFCFPHFDSPSVFGALLDDTAGGYFKIAPTSGQTARKQFYWPETNILVSRFLCTDGVGEIVDFMVPADNGRTQREYPDRLFRRVSCIKGEMAFRLECFPAFNYARDEHETKISAKGASFRSPDLNLGLSTHISLKNKEKGAVAEFALKEGESAVFMLHEIDPNSESEACPSKPETSDIFVRTVQFWRRWLSKCTYTGRWREMVQRSALMLKLLTFAPTGAIVASATTSLPESIGGERNWDYRYTWIRDAAFTLYGLIRIGFTEEAARFMDYLEARSHELNPDGSLQVMYGIDGRHDLEEEILSHLDGYRGSKPVRIGNGAYKQRQMDIYGELMDSVYLFNKYRSPISYELWTHLRRMLDYVSENWQKKDEGIWEVRGGRKHFVYSKLMCWVALDRGLRLAEKRSFPSNRESWHNTRDQIYEEIMRKGWNPGKKAFVQHYESDSLDASNLIMPLVFFLSPSDPRMLQTLDAILESPANGGLVSNSLVYRYSQDQSEDGIKGAEGTFNICTFWLVEALTRAGKFDNKRLEQARLMFEQMLGYANHLGIYAEETGPRGEALGNFPQAFTHLSLISSAFNLDRALSG